MAYDKTKLSRVIAVYILNADSSHCNEMINIARDALPGCNKFIYCKFHSIWHSFFPSFVEVSQQRLVCFRGSPVYLYIYACSFQEKRLIWWLILPLPQGWKS